MTPPAILLVDDDRDYLEIAERALRREKLDHLVRFARTGQEALTLLGLLDGGAPAPDPVDVVALFVDLHIPGVDGFEILRCVRAEPRLSRLPIVVLSSSARPEDIRRSYELGANSYLVKRFDRAGPGHYLVRAIRYWTELNRVTTDPAGARP